MNDYPCTCKTNPHAAGCAAAPLSELGIVQPHPPDGFQIHELFADRATLLAACARLAVLAVADAVCDDAQRPALRKETDRAD